MTIRRTMLALAAGSILSAPLGASAACSVSAAGEVNTLSNSYPVLEVITGAMKECGSGNLVVTSKLTTEHKDETNQAAAASTSPYDLFQVSNSTFTPLQSSGQLRELDDLIAKYRDKYDIEDSMVISVGGKAYAIAFQVNAQHLFYRKDLFDKHGIAVPTTYDEVVAAAAKLAGETSVDHPLSGTYKSGWNLAQEFINMYLAFGGDIFEPGTAQPAFNGRAGVQALETMKKLSEYMSPNYLALDSTAVMQQFQQGQVAMANLWASRAEKMDDPSESQVVGKIEFAAAPLARSGGAPATTLWWDGWVIPKNLDGDADLAFQVMMEGLGKDIVAANNDASIWLRSNYKPTRFASGAAASARAGAPNYPMVPQMSLAHNALGENIGDFLAGTESAQESLDDAAAAYTQTAKEKGLL